MKNSLFIFLACLFFCSSAFAAEDIVPPKQIKWSFEGAFGSFDRRSAQRGLQVYKEVCAACHSLSHIAYRNLEEIGFSKAEVKELANDIDVRDGPNDEGEMFERPGKPSDHFPDPYPNENAARAANNGAHPPDLSLIIKAREDGANYVHSLITGFGKTPPKNMHIGDGMYYNPYFPGMQIAMAPPIADGMVDYTDGTKATAEQMSRDVVSFLQWAAEPEMERRKEMGLKVLAFLFIFTGLFYISKKRIWSKLK